VQGLFSFVRLAWLLQAWDSFNYHRRCCVTGLIWALVWLLLSFHQGMQLGWCNIYFSSLA